MWPTCWMSFMLSCKEKTKLWSIWSAQLMLSNEKWFGKLPEARGRAGDMEQNDFASLEPVARASRSIHVLPCPGRCWACFTGMFHLNSSGVEEGQSSWTLVEPTHRGQVAQHQEMCYLLDCIIYVSHEDHEVCLSPDYASLSASHQSNELYCAI